MKLKISSTSFMVGAALVLLAVLGTLQYRWLGKVKEGERELMQANLRAGAARFREDFDREVTRAYTSFRLDGEALSGRDWRTFAAHYDEWNTAAPHPRLVKSIYLIELNSNVAGADPRLAKFNETKRQFEESAWTGELAGLRGQLEDGQTREADGRTRRSIIEDSVVEEIPALVVPIITLKMTAENVQAERDLVGYIVVVLDLDYIKRDLVPLIARRYFASGGQLDYNFSIYSRRDPRRVIYQSDVHAPLEDSAMADVTTDILSLDLAKVGDPSAAHAVRSPASPESAESGRAPYTIIVPSEKGKDLPSDKPLFLDNSGRWKLVVQHRAGSLEAAVAAMRRRNLAISFGILALLAASIAAVIITSRRAQRLARQQVEFVTNVSHEFRTPLAVIHAVSENLADGLVEDKRQVMESGTVIRHDARRLSEMIEQVLEFAGAQRGKKLYDLQSVDIADAITDTLKNIEPIAQRDGWEIEREVAAPLPLVRADKAALDRALRNLIENAMKYSDGNRWLAVRARADAGAPKPPQIIITVEDRGAGIPAEDLPHIFEPFYRGRSAIAAQIRGAGLGLSLVKQIVEAHGGSVEVENCLERGSRFTVRLPADGVKPGDGESV